MQAPEMEPVFFLGGIEVIEAIEAIVVIEAIEAIEVIEIIVVIVVIVGAWRLILDAVGIKEGF